MIKRVRVGLILIGIILSIASPIALNPVSANPTEVAMTKTGRLLSTNHSLMMPEAYVSIILESDRISKITYSHDITIYGNYTIVSPITTNTTIAFAYPDTWVYDYDADTLQLDFEMFVDGIRVSYEVKNASDFLQNEIEGSLTPGLLFAMFNKSVQENETFLLELVCNIHAIVTTEYYMFSYYLGTARTWSGDVHERIRFDIKNYEQFSDCNFFPDSSVAETIIGSSLVGEWDLNLSDLFFDYIKATCTQYDFGLTQYDYLIIIVAFSPATIFIVLSIIAFRKRNE